MNWREAISRVKIELKEANADSRAPNKFIYSKLLSKSTLLVQRESDSLKLGKLQGLYQIIPCITMNEVPAIDPKCNICSDLNIYRSCNKLPELYYDLNGVLIKSIRTLDRFGKTIKLESLDYIINNSNDINNKYDKTIYGFYENGYLYMKKKVPVKIEGYFKKDISQYSDCDCNTEHKDCVRFLDTKWYVPEKLEDAIISLVVQELANVYKRLPDQQVIDKNDKT